MPDEARKLPQDLAAPDTVLSDPALLAPIAADWERWAQTAGPPLRGTVLPSDESRKRPTSGRWSSSRARMGYGALVRELADSLHLRRFCLIGLGQRVPDDSTVRRLTRRLGDEVVDERTRLVIEKAPRDALSARDEDRLDGRRGRHALPERRGG